MPETCNSRHFSWLVKSCFPYPNINPHQPQPHSPSSTAANYRQRSRTTTTASSLPDDVILECLSRVPATSLPAVSLVCRRWSRILNSAAFTFLRRRLGLLRPTIFAVSDSPLLAASHRLGDGGQEGGEDKWKLTAFPACCDAVLAHSRVVAVGRRIYVLGRNVVLRYDTWTGTVSERAPMLFARKKFASAEIAGKIYVAGGSSGTAAVEVYDPATDRWRVVTEAPRKRYGCIGASVDGVFYVIGGLKIGCTWDAAPRSQDALVYARSMDIYDAGEGAWLRSRIVPGGGCVVAACAAAGRVYVLASHALELTVWRFDGRRKGASFGEWSRIRSPPLPPQVRLDSSVRFSCVGVGDKVVLVQVLGCIDDLLRRSGRTVRGLREGLVLVYDTTGEEWKRGADLPEVIRRAACVCVEC